MSSHFYWINHAHVLKVGDELAQLQHLGTSSVPLSSFRLLRGCVRIHGTVDFWTRPFAVVIATHHGCFCHYCQECSKEAHGWWANQGFQVWPPILPFRVSKDTETRSRNNRECKAMQIFWVPLFRYINVLNKCIASWARRLASPEVSCMGTWTGRLWVCWEQCSHCRARFHGFPTPPLCSDRAACLGSQKTFWSSSPGRSKWSPLHGWRCRLPWIAMVLAFYSFHECLTQQLLTAPLSWSSSASFLHHVSAASILNK